MDAETAYIFRHALLRDAAYDLQPPEERALLHGLAHDVVTKLFAGLDAELDSFALELARHAGAAAAVQPRYLVRECEWLHRAARFANLGWRGTEAAVLYLRVADHPAADAEQKSQALCGAGKSLLDIGRLPEALTTLERALELAPGDTGRLMALRPLSYAYRNVGRHEDALAAARQIERIGRSSANPVEQALVLDAIATALLGLERNEEALPIAEQAVACAERGADPRVLGGMRANLGLLLGRLGQRERGVQCLRQALEDLRPTGERRTIAAARRNLADQLRANGQPDAARVECDEALREMRLLGDKRGEGMAMLTLGGIERDVGRAELALPLLADGADLLAASGDMRSAAVALCNAATAWLDIDNFAKCEATLVRSLEFARAGNSPRAEAMALTVRADMLRDMKQWQQAAAAYDLAHAAQARVGETKQAAWQLGERAVALRYDGDPGASAAYEAALAALRLAAPDDLQHYVDKWQAAST